MGDVVGADRDQGDLGAGSVVDQELGRPAPPGPGIRAPPTARLPNRHRPARRSRAIPARSSPRGVAGAAPTPVPGRGGVARVPRRTGESADRSYPARARCRAVWVGGPRRPRYGGGRTWSAPLTLSNRAAEADQPHLRVRRTSATRRGATGATMPLPRLSASTHPDRPDSRPGRLPGVASPTGYYDTGRARALRASSISAQIVRISTYLLA